jgi:hypothetical protein
MYKIKDIQRRRANFYGVEIKPSARKGKKIDVFKNGVKLASIGALGFKDYATHYEEKGKAYAEKRRTAYLIRHAKDVKKGGAGLWAWRILW